VVGQACWDKSAVPDPKYCGGSFNELTITNGAIAQHSDAAGYSHAVRLGQGSGRGLHLEKLRIKVSSHSSVPISTIGQKGTTVSDVQIENGVTTIGNRHQIEGVAIRLLDEYKSDQPVEIRNVTISGGPQGGILVTAPGSQVHDNDISLLGRYTNDFGIYLWGHRSEARNNDIHGQSRGIQIDRATGAVARENQISVFEKPTNEEYKGCEVAGTFGIQVESRSQQALVENNQVNALADECDARAFRVTATKDGSGTISRGNKFTARRRPGAKTKAISASFVGAHSVRLERDILDADSANVEVGWEGARDIVLQDVTFIKGPNAALDYATFSFRAGSGKGVAAAPTASLTIIDGTFLKGASPESYSMMPIGYEKWAQPVEYFIQWTQRFKITSGDQPVVGAAVTIDGGKNEKYELLTDASGETPPVVLTEFRRSNTSTTVSTEIYVYRVNVVHQGKTLRFTIQPKAKSTIVKELR
jgi:hypothetical protein